MTSLMKWKINLEMYLGYRNFYIVLARKKEQNPDATLLYV